MARLSHKKENLKNNKKIAKESNSEASCLSERKAAKERGPTKKQLREELKTQEKLKKIKNQQKKGKITSEEAQSKKKRLMDTEKRPANGKARKENIATEQKEKRILTSDNDNSKNTELKDDSKKSGSPKRSSKNLQLKRKSEKKMKEENAEKKVKKHSKKKKNSAKVGNIFYTEENINSFLIEAKNKNLKDKAAAMIMFLFKTFKENPAELLAKIKILTSDKKVNTEGLSTHMAIISHLFVFFGMKSDFFENLFSLIMSDSLLSKYACSYLYSQRFENEEYDEHFHKICSELARVLEKTSALPLDDYLDYVNEIDLMENLEDFKFDETHEDSELCANSKQEMNKFEEAQDMLCEPDENDDTFSLKSLNDDDEIRRIDMELGKYFSKGSISFKESVYVYSLSKYFETFLKTNYATNIDYLKSILYFYQFDSISVIFKHIVKKFISKFSDSKRLFRIYQVCCIVDPSLYGLYNVFLSACKADFQHLAFLKSALNFGHEDFLVNKINKDVFYGVYSPNLGPEFDDFMKNVILAENRHQKLIELSQKVYGSDVQEEIAKAIDRVKSKKDTSSNFGEN